ncbi:MAG: hypothetical protein QXP36_09485 [Conexivisphaerales archaeon]
MLTLSNQVTVALGGLTIITIIWIVMEGILRMLINTDISSDLDVEDIDLEKELKPEKRVFNIYPNLGDWRRFPEDLFEIKKLDNKNLSKEEDDDLNPFVVGSAGWFAAQASKSDDHNSYNDYSNDYYDNHHHYDNSPPHHSSPFDD